MFKFLKRQAKTKTGRLGIALIAGSVAEAVFGSDTGGKVTQVADAVLSPETGILGLAAMFLRDKEAKKDERGEG